MVRGFFKGNKMKNIILGIQAVILASLLSYNTDSYSRDGITFNGADCINLGLLQKNIYNARQNGMDRMLFIRNVRSQPISDKEKNFIVDEINFIYDLPKDMKYYEYTYKECVRNSKIIRKKA